MESTETVKSWLLERATQLGFVAAGIAPAGPVESAPAYRYWLAAGRHGPMAYMARNVQPRCDVTALEPWARSVLCVAASYAPSPDSDAPVARYARGRDYHKVLKQRLHRLADELARRVPGARTRACVDTAPLLERALAARAGLGWIGANTCLIHPRFGSYLLLGELLLSIELPPDAPIADRCGPCTRCRAACPTGAIVAPRVVDARRCISCATIEHRGPYPVDEARPQGQIVGCDVCQRVCPHNCDLPPGLDELTTPLPVATTEPLAVLRWTFDDWDAATRGSAARRAPYAMLLRNAAIAAGQAGLSAARADLDRLATHEDPAVATAARWALERLGPIARGTDDGDTPR